MLLLMKAPPPILSSLSNLVQLVKGAAPEIGAQRILVLIFPTTLLLRDGTRELGRRHHPRHHRRITRLLLRLLLLLLRLLLLLTPYILVPPKDTARSQLLRRVKFISLFGLESGGFFVVVQIIIALCGGLVALLDRASSVCFIKGLRFWDHDVECWCPNDGAPTPTAAPTFYPLDPTDAPQPECVSGSLLVEGVLPPFMRGTNAAGLVADYYLLGVVLFFFAIGLFSCCAGGCTKFCGKKKKNAGAETSAAQLLE